MSTVTFGAAVTLELSPPEPPPFNLLTVAEEIRGGLDGDGGFDPHWRMGAFVWPYPPELASGEDPCVGEGSDAKAEAEEIDTPLFGAFTAYQPIVCSTLGTRDFAELQRRANAAFAAHEANALERQLAQAEFKLDNPALQDATDILGGGTVAAGPGLALLENAIGETAENGVIHATPGIVSAWTQLGSAIYRDGSRLRTLAGTPIVRGTGYIGVGIAGQTAPNPDAGVEWAFATGPVAYARSPEIHFGPPELAQALDRESNRIVYRAERDYLVAWDLTLLAAVVIDWMP